MNEIESSKTDSKINDIEINPTMIHIVKITTQMITAIPSFFRKIK